MRARVANADEERKYRPKLIALDPDFEIYRARAQRDIPIVLLTPV